MVISVEMFRAFGFASESLRGSQLMSITSENMLFLDWPSNFLVCTICKMYLSKYACLRDFVNVHLNAHDKVFGMRRIVGKQRIETP